MDAGFVTVLGVLFFLSLLTFSAIVLSTSLDRQVCGVFGTPYHPDMYVKPAPLIPHSTDSFTIVNCGAT